MKNEKCIMDSMWPLEYYTECGGIIVKMAPSSGLMTAGRHQIHGFHSMSTYIIKYFDTFEIAPNFSFMSR